MAKKLPSRILATHGGDARYGVKKLASVVDEQLASTSRFVDLLAKSGLVYNHGPVKKIKGAQELWGAWHDMVHDQVRLQRFLRSIV